MLDSSCYLEFIELCRFRNYSFFSFSPGRSSVVVVGPNGSGKTNLLEAVSLVSRHSGMRFAKISDMLSSSSSDVANGFFSGDDVAWSVAMKFCEGAGVLRDVRIFSSNGRRLVRVDDKLCSNYISSNGLSSVLWLLPSMDYALLKSPVDRLKFFDRIFCAQNKDYLTYSIQYERAKKHRSVLLRDWCNGVDGNWLSSLESIMADSGLLLSEIRRDIIVSIQDALNHLKPFRRKLRLFLDSEVCRILDGDLVDCDPAEFYRRKLRDLRAVDAGSGRVAFGSHRDGLSVLDVDRNMRAELCSTGEQKLFLISLVIASVFLRSKSGSVPILLLDDIMSHIDLRYREDLVELLLCIGCQVWITDVDERNFSNFCDDFVFLRLGY